MENKYYTPDISEFHVGFECESNYILVNNGEKDLSKFIPFTFTKSNFAYMIDAYIEDAYRTEFRVKYLDKDDIESLGFEHDQSTKDGSYFYSGTLMTENQWCINLKDFIVDIYDINGKSDFRFNGFIKNKSELKQILKMIGYESEQMD